MSAKINIYVTPRDVALDIRGQATALDLILAISALFDRLEPEHKKLVMEKFENIVDLEEGAMLNPKE